ncbi:MAG: hypothetical protein QOF55_2188, partial [Thermoleophilaceae bacterium]|nr:hypothetical protein [Thermoleophilaceae bacterium]
MTTDTSTPTPERPVFAATGGARPRALKLAGRMAAGIVGLWLVALVLGALGFGHVAGIQLPRILGGEHTKSVKADLKAPAPAPAPASAAVRATAVGIHAVNRPPVQRRPATNAGPRRRGTRGGGGGPSGNGSGTT